MAGPPVVIAARAGDIEKLMRKLDARYLVEPEIEAGIERIAEEMKTRHDRRKGLGARRNIMAIERMGRLERRVTSTPRVSGWQPKPLKGQRGAKGSGTPRPKWQENVPTYNPRRTGRAWTAAQIKRWTAMVPRVLNKAVQGIESRWSA